MTLQDRLEDLNKQKKLVFDKLHDLNLELYSVNEMITQNKSLQFIERHGIKRADVEMMFADCQNHYPPFDIWGLWSIEPTHKPWVAWHGSLFGSDDFAEMRFGDFTGRVCDLEH